MFKGQKDKSAVVTDEVETIIGPSVKIEGDFKSNGNVMVGGIVSGKFSTTQNLRVEESAQILADVEAREAIIAGEIRGNIKISGHLEILASARITGDIITGTISIQQGAVINGKCSMQTGDQTAAPVEIKSKEQLTTEWIAAADEENP